MLGKTVALLYFSALTKIHNKMSTSMKSGKILANE